mgnify:CR=1 FL=1
MQNEQARNPPARLGLKKEPVQLKQQMHRFPPIRSFAK